MNARQRVLSAIGCAACLVLLSGFSCSKPQSGQVTVMMRHSAFVPDKVVVTEGTLVTWINDDSEPHTVTAVGAFDSGPIAPNGGRWTWVAALPGTFTYKSLIQPDMTGTITVVPSTPTGL